MVSWLVHWTPDGAVRVQALARDTMFYYISKLVRALLLVNLAGRTLLHGPLKF